MPGRRGGGEISVRCDVPVPLPSPAAACERFAEAGGDVAGAVAHLHQREPGGCGEHRPPQRLPAVTPCPGPTEVDGMGTARGMRSRSSPLGALPPSAPSLDEVQKRRSSTKQPLVQPLRRRKKGILRDSSEFIPIPVTPEEELWLVGIGPAETGAETQLSSLGGTVASADNRELGPRTAIADRLPVKAGALHGPGDRSPAPETADHVPPLPAEDGDTSAISVPAGQHPAPRLHDALHAATPALAAVTRSASAQMDEEGSRCNLAGPDSGESCCCLHSASNGLATSRCSFRTRSHAGSDSGGWEEVPPLSMFTATYSAKLAEFPHDPRCVASEQLLREGGSGPISTRSSENLEVNAVTPLPYLDGHVLGSSSSLKSSSQVDAIMPLTRMDRQPFVDFPVPASPKEPRGKPMVVGETRKQLAGPVGELRSRHVALIALPPVAPTLITQQRGNDHVNVVGPAQARVTGTGAGGKWARVRQGYVQLPTKEQKLDLSNQNVTTPHAKCRRHVTRLRFMRPLPLGDKRCPDMDPLLSRTHNSQSYTPVLQQGKVPALAEDNRKVARDLRKLDKRDRNLSKPAGEPVHLGKKASQVNIF